MVCLAGLVPAAAGRRPARRQAGVQRCHPRLPPHHQRHVDLPGDWHAVVGIKGRAAFGDGHWFVPYYLDLGAGESRITWQALAGIGYSFGWGDVVAAWRYIDYQMKSGKPVEDVNFSGPGLAAVFRF